MSRADRLERLDSDRLLLEAEYETALVAALREAAGGSWGLFGHNQDKHASAKWKQTITQLCDQGAEIDQMRETLGIGPFALHEAFEASRGPVASNAPGEPKQAKAWLERMGQSL